MSLQVEHDMTQFLLSGYIEKETRINLCTSFLPVPPYVCPPKKEAS